MNLYSIITFILSFNFVHCIAQFPSSKDIDKGDYVVLDQDTSFRNESYNLVEYYETGQVKALVNVDADSTANGKCVFFRKNGKILAQGQFQNNRAKDKWTYNNKICIPKKHQDWEWSSGFDPVTHVVVIDKKEKVYQIVYWEHGRIRFYLDGKYIGGMSL